MLLIDEPDAFLHPPLARRLGTELTNLASERKGNVIASTHDSNFLMGCIQVGKPVNIVRLTYEGFRPSARLLEPNQLRQMMRDPLLRSTRVLDALFHRGAVICEADSDRAFYQEINDRMIMDKRPAAVDCIFLNAQNKQTVRRIVQPLRQMGIPAAAIVDMDIIRKNNNNDLRDLMIASGVPDSLIHAWGQLRGEVESAFHKLKLSPKQVGLAGLEGGEKDAAQNLLDGLSKYGIFVAPIGELEKWLAHLGVPSGAEQKRDWLPRIFEKMGDDPESPLYLRPGHGDVWTFVESIAAWIGDPARKGMSGESPKNGA